MGKQRKLVDVFSRLRAQVANDYDGAVDLDTFVSTYDDVDLVEHIHETVRGISENRVTDLETDDETRDYERAVLLRNEAHDAMTRWQTEVDSTGFVSGLMHTIVLKLGSIDAVKLMKWVAFKHDQP